MHPDRRAGPRPARDRTTRRDRSGIQRAQVALIGLDQIPLDHGVQRRLDARVLLGRPEDLLCTASTQQVADQHPAWSLDEGVER
jgi:hypothetical protein